MNEIFLAAVFDMDGTLIASERIYRAAWQCAAGELRWNLTTQEYERLMGLNRADTIRELARQFRSASAAESFIARSEDHYHRIVKADGHEIRPTIRALLEELRRRRVPLAVATSTHRELAEATLNSVRLREYFSVVVTGDEVLEGKPHPAIYLRAAQALHVSPERCLAFEDSKAGATAASAAGMTVVLIPELSAVETTGIPRTLSLVRHLDALRYFPAGSGDGSE